MEPENNYIYFCIIGGLDVGSPYHAAF